jgi:glycosyltransferase involved in cell wall biosynthesis
MNVLFTPHVEHYTIGMAQYISRHVNFWILSTSRLEGEGLYHQLILPNVKGVRGILRIFALKTLSKTLFDIVHANDSWSGFWSNAYDTLIVTEHGWPDPHLQHESAKSYYLKESQALLYLYEIGVPIITISNFTANMLKKRFGVKCYKVIYHGLLDCFRTKAPRTLKKGIPTILWISRLVPLKEPEILIAALKILKEKYALNFKTIIRGDGPLKSYMQYVIDKFDLAARVRFIGKISFHELPKLYESASILVHTSSYEPFGFCILEAMGMALPVIVPKYGGAYEVAGTAAIGFKPHDPSDLAEKIYTCLQDPSYYYKSSTKSLERSKFFDWSKTAAEYLKVYKKFL